MNNENKDFLLEEITALQEDVPPMPDDFHQRWMQKIKEEDPPMTSKKNIRPWLVRGLSAAAALVFVVSGALFAMDAMEMNKASSGVGSVPFSRSMSNDTDLYREEASDYGAYGTMTLTSNGAAPKMASAQTKLIRTASMSISTQAFDDSLTSLKLLCTEQGGWIESASESTGSNGLRTAYLTLRLPAEALDAYLEGSAGTGRVTRRNESVQDVTESYQDTAAQLTTQQALMARLQALVTDAASLSELLELESQIADTQYTIDRLQASLNSTDRQVNYSTVDITLKEEALSTQTEDITFLQRLGLALEEGWEAFVTFLENITVFAFAALPFIAIVAVVWLTCLGVRKIIKRRK